MLTEQRYEMILNLLEENKIVTVTQKCSTLCDRLSQNGLIVGDRLFAGMTDSEKQCFSELVTKALCNLSKAENI